MLKTKSCGVILVLVLSAIVGTGIVLAEDVTTIGIQVAPSTLNINPELGGECDNVTVHADINFSLVNCDTLELNVSGLDVVFPVSYFADDRGDLVVKFNRADVADDAELVGPNDDTLELTLTGETNEEVPTAFTCKDTIRVIDSGKTQ